MMISDDPKSRSENKSEKKAARKSFFCFVFCGCVKEKERREGKRREGKGRSHKTRRDDEMEGREERRREIERLIGWSLKNMIFSNALFFAERLHEMENDADSLHLLALTYHRMGRLQQACALLNRSLTTDANRYLFAVSSFELGRYEDAKNSLSPRDNSSSVPNGAAGHFLLASCFQ